MPSGSHMRAKGERTRAALLALADAGVSPTQAARALNLSRARACIVLSELRRAGLVSRRLRRGLVAVEVTGPRAVYSLTDAGRRALGATRPVTG